MALLGRLLAAQSGVDCVQVLQEFASVALTTLGPPNAALRVQLAVPARFELVIIDADLVGRAAELRGRDRLRCQDAGILAAAERAGCETLYTEDPNHGQVDGSIRVNNPSAE